jgi:hypothetical protein
MQAVEGWGANHAVCVGYAQPPYLFVMGCSGGPNEHVYRGLGGAYYGEPYIQNAGGSNNLVNGVAWQP